MPITTIVISVLVALVLGMFIGGLLAQIKTTPASCSPSAAMRLYDEIDVMAPDPLDAHPMVQHISVRPGAGWIIYGDRLNCIITAEAMAETVGTYTVCTTEDMKHWLHKDALIITDFNPTSLNILQAQLMVENTNCALIFISRKIPLLDANSNLRTLAV